MGNFAHLHQHIRRMQVHPTLPAQLVNPVKHNLIEEVKEVLFEL